MNTLVWSNRFIKSTKKIIKKRPDLITKIEITLKKLEKNYLDDTLFSHKLKGEFKGLWACKVEYDYRIIFEIINRDNYIEILLLTIGTHDEVY